jgi:AcrR family transcriptional regulator
LARRRLSREDRRAQLLDSAAAIVRAEGVDALTLARVAEAAGVTKPIAYGHFETRAGLLKALYLRIDEQQCEAARMALDAKARTLEEAVQVLAEAYVDCVLHVGTAFGAITAALSAIPDTEAFLHAGRERYAEIYLETLERFATLPRRESKAVMVGIIGAAEALTREVMAHRLARAEAVDAIGRIMLGAVKSAPAS